MSKLCAAGFISVKYPEDYSSTWMLTASQNMVKAWKQADSRCSVTGVWCWGKVTLVPAVHRGASECLIMEAGETTVDLGREQENYLLGLGLGK